MALGVLSRLSGCAPLLSRLRYVNYYEMECHNIFAQIFMVPGGGSLQTLAMLRLFF